jgi:hypothetical protein
MKKIKFYTHRRLLGTGRQIKELHQQKDDSISLQIRQLRLLTYLRLIDK